MQDVSAIIVMITILDNNSQKLLGGISLGSLVSQFPDSGFTDPVSPTGTTLPAAAWQAKLTQTSLTLCRHGSYSFDRRSQIEVYQRFFYLNQ